MCFMKLASLLWKSYLFVFWPHWAACGILVPWPGIEPVPPAVEAWSLINHWTAREVPFLFCFDESLWYRISCSIFEFCFFDMSIGLGCTNSLQEVTGCPHRWIWHTYSELRDVLWNIQEPLTSYIYLLKIRQTLIVLNFNIMIMYHQP